MDQTSSIVGGYVRAGSTGVALAVDENVTTEGTYEAPSAAGKVRIGTPANMRTGTYELHFHNDLFAVAADSVFITLGGASNMADLILEIQLTDVDLNDGVRGAMTALPNAAADAPFGLPISDSGGLDIDTLLGRITGNVATQVKLLAYLQLLARSDAAISTDNATELGEINANEGSGAGDYANTTESQEAIRDRGDAAWPTAAGFSTHDAAAVKTAIEAGGSSIAQLLGATFDTATDSLEAIRNRGDAAWITGATGGGSVEWVVTVDDGSNPLEGVQVWVTTDEAGTNVIASGTTDTLGRVTFMLDAGSYFAWKQLAGMSFTNPEAMAVA